MKIHCLDRQTMSSHTLVMINRTRWLNITNPLRSKNEQKKLHFGKTWAIQSNENCFNFYYNMNWSRATGIFSENNELFCAIFGVIYPILVAKSLKYWPPPRQNKVKFKNK